MNKIEFESEKKVDVVMGQIYRLVGEYDVEPYIVSRVEATKYCLISLATGNRWSEPERNIGDIFNGDEFTLTTEPFKVIPKVIPNKCDP